MRPPRRGLAGLILLLALSFAGAGAARAQAGTTLQGRVVEAGSGAGIEGATVRVTGTQEAAAVTDAEGRWRIEALPPGEYRVRVTRLGYAAGRQTAVLPGASALRVALSPAALPLDALVVTASRRMQRLADAPVATELITRREIEHAGAADLASVLIERTGIQLEGGHPAGAGVMLQGLGSERVLVLLDGQPVIGRLSGQIDVSRIPTSMVQRIEVVKGPQSALYGSEAMGGVINIITRDILSTGWGGELRLTAGTQDRMDAGGSLRGSLGEVGYVADLGRRSIGLTPGQPGTTGALAERWDALLRTSWAPSPYLRLEAGGLLLQERQRWPSGQLFFFADNWQRGGRLGGEWHRGGHRLQSLLYLSEFEHLARRGLTSVPVAGTGEREVQRLLEAEVLYSTQLGPHVVDAGIELKREQIESDRVTAHDRALHAVEPFLQSTLSVGRWQFVPGVRLTWSEQWGAHWTPRLAALFRPIEPLALRASIGRGYRAPGFKELYMDFLNLAAGTGYVVRGNAELRPETSTNLTLGAEWAVGHFFARGQLFHNRFRDFIETREAGDSSGILVFTYRNVEDGYTQGAELEAGAVRGAFRIEAGYSYLDAENETLGVPLLGRAAHSGRLSLGYELPTGTRASLAGIYTGATPVTTEPRLEERDGFLRWDLQLAHALPRGLELTLGADNLFDARPDDWPGFTGRHLYLGLTWRGTGGGATAAN